MKLFGLIITLFAGFMFFACNQENENPIEEPINTVVEDPLSLSLEAYMDSVDNGNYHTLSSLSYNKEDGSAAEAQLLVDDSSRVVLMAERYITPESSSYQSNFIYFKGGQRVATKEYYEIGDMENGSFIERITYYVDGKPKVAKKREAEYEDELMYQEFQTTDAEFLSDDNINQIFNQEGPYATTFQGFIQSNEDGELYLLVGEDSPTGFTSAIMVQQLTPILKRLKESQMEFIGTPLKVEFENVADGQGYTFQLLTGIGFAEEK